MIDHEKTIKKLNVEITYNNHQRALFYNATLHYVHFTYRNQKYVYSASNLGSYILSKNVNNEDAIICSTKNYQKMENAILGLGN